MAEAPNPREDLRNAALSICKFMDTLTVSARQLDPAGLEGSTEHQAYLSSSACCNASSKLFPQVELSGMLCSHSKKHCLPAPRSLATPAVCSLMPRPPSVSRTMRMSSMRRAALWVMSQMRPRTTPRRPQPLSQRATMRSPLLRRQLLLARLLMLASVLPRLVVPQHSPLRLLMSLRLRRPQRLRAACWLSKGYSLVCSGGIEVKM